MKQRKGIIYMSNQMIGKCKYCDQNYCIECSTHQHWKEFCSEGCYDKYQDEGSPNIATLPTAD